MIKKGVRLSNDQVDKHGDRMTINALRSARDQTNSKIMSSHDEHDYRNPPIGRMETSYIRNINGVNWLLGDFRLFAPEDINRENRLKGRELSVHDTPVGDISVAYDRSYEINDLVNDVELLQKAFNPNGFVLFEGKKSAEPISTLTIFIGIGATFAASQFFSGFFNEAGKNSWDYLRKLIVKNASVNPHADKQYNFVFTFKNEYYKVEVMIIFTNPEPDDVRNVIEINQSLIDEKVIKYYSDNVRARKIVYTCENQKFSHAYSVYKCGTPFDISNIAKYQQLLKDKSGE